MFVLWISASAMKSVLSFFSKVKLYWLRQLLSLLLDMIRLRTIGNRSLLDSTLSVWKTVVFKDLLFGTVVLMTVAFRSVEVGKVTTEIPIDPRSLVIIFSCDGDLAIDRLIRTHISITTAVTTDTVKNFTTPYGRRC